MFQGKASVFNICIHESKKESGVRMCIYIYIEIRRTEVSRKIVMNRPEPSPPLVTRSIDISLQGI